MTPIEAGLWGATTRPTSYDLSFAMLNEKELREAQSRSSRAWWAEHGHWPHAGTPICGECPDASIDLHWIEDLPDILALGSSCEVLVSARLRYAMALPDACVQYWPVKLVSAAESAHRQDYRWLSYLASERILDFGRSRYTLHEVKQEVGDPHPQIRSVEEFVVPDRFEPHANLFRIFGFELFFAATELLIRRLERAGCTGMMFFDLARYLKDHEMVARPRRS